MPGFDALAAAMTSVCFGTLGQAAVWTPVTGSPVQTMAVLDRNTFLRGQLGDVIDPRPSVRLPLADVGSHPRGSLLIDGASWTLDRPVEDGNDGQVVRMWVTAA